MQIMIKPSRKANAMMRKRQNNLIRREHLEKANAIRAFAKDMAENADGYVSESDIQQMLTDSELRAIELENCKCMERH